MSFAATVYYPSRPHCSEKEEQAGKFDGNYVAVSLYNVDTGDVWGGELYRLNLEGRRLKLARLVVEKALLYEDVGGL